MRTVNASNCVADVQRVGDASPVDYSQWNSVQAKELPCYEVFFSFCNCHHQNYKAEVGLTV
jgi:hypothetical protein